MTADNDDPIIDRSPQQKHARIAPLREELHDSGYCIVSAEWLAATLRSIAGEEDFRP